MEALSSNLRSQLLIAMPGMDDPNFHRTVTLICEHNDKGCFGLTINRPIEVTLGDLFEQLKIDSEHNDLLGESAVNGGPVKSGQGFVLHGTGQSWEGTLKINDDLAITSSRDILDDIAAGKGPDQFLLALGCASWAPGQVEDELLENAWLTCPVDNRILFDTPFSERWTGAASLLGIDVALISGVAGHA